MSLPKCSRRDNSLQVVGPPKRIERANRPTDHAEDEGELEEDIERDFLLCTAAYRIVCNQDIETHPPIVEEPTKRTRLQITGNPGEEDDDDVDDDLILCKTDGS